MTQSELNSIPLYSRVRAYWGSTQLDGYVIDIKINAVIYIPSLFAIIHDYPASGITLIEAYQPDYVEYPQYNLNTLPMFSQVLVSYDVIRKTGTMIDKSYDYNQVYVFYPDGNAEWINIDYISFISAPSKPPPSSLPPEEYTPGEQPPGEVRTYPDDEYEEIIPEPEQNADTIGQSGLKSNFVVGIIAILLIALIK
jgi:hypothetical protein